MKQPHKSSRRSPDMRRRSNSVRERERGERLMDVFYGCDETVPSGEVANFVCLSVYLRASSLCLRNAWGEASLCVCQGRHMDSRLKSLLFGKNTPTHTHRHIYNHILALTAQTKTLPSSPLDASDGPPKPLCDSNTRSHVITTFLRFGLYQHTGHYKCVRSTRVALTDL